MLEDAGEPAHVRNDFRGAFLRAGGGSPFDRGSAFERFVADSFGQSGVPAPGKPVDRPNVLAYITAADAQGLADRTQRRFFSDGTLPADVVVDRDTTPAEVLRDARDALAYGLPTVPRLELAAMGDVHYAYAPRGRTLVRRARAAKLPPQRRRLLAYERVPGHVRFFLDPASTRTRRARCCPRSAPTAPGSSTTCCAARSSWS